MKYVFDKKLSFDSNDSDHDAKIDEIIIDFEKQYALPQTVEKYGIFVTIKNHGILRGCIGGFSVTNHTGRLVAKQALQSAFSDSRFYDEPIKESELSDLSYDINFIGELKQIYPNEENENENDIVKVLNKSGFIIGKKKGHGIQMHFSNGESATFLASVLPELKIYSFDKDTVERLITELKLKASGSDTITRIEMYQCQEYNEYDKFDIPLLKNKIDGGSIETYIKNKNIYKSLKYK